MDQTQTAKPGACTPDNFQTLLDAGAAQTIVRLETSPQRGVPVAVIPHGYKLGVVPLNQLEHYAGKPSRKTGLFAFDDVHSFIRYFNEHKTDDSRIFARFDHHSGSFSAILNFHGAEPSFNDHSCVIQLRPTPEWNKFNLCAGQQMTQATFAQFLEENAEWFVDPSGANLLEIITELEGKAHVDIVQAVKLQTGAIKLTYTETVELKGGGTSNQSGDMQVPKVFTVQIAPFEGTRHYEIKARLRFRIENRKILFWYEPMDVALIVRALGSELADTIERSTNVIPFRVPPGGLDVLADGKPW